MALLLRELAGYVRDDSIVKVAGPDRLNYLHSLLSQDMESARAGDVSEFLYLDGDLPAEMANGMPLPIKIKMSLFDTMIAQAGGPAEEGEEKNRHDHQRRREGK